MALFLWIVCLAKSSLVIATSKDLHVLTQHFLAEDLAQANAKLAASYAANLRPDGSWPDINYSDTSVHGNWQPGMHLDRQLVLAATARKFNNSDLVEATIASIKFYLQRDPKSANWFLNELFAPGKIADAALTIQPWLSPSESDGLVSIMERAHWQGRTGANLVAEVMTQIKRGCFLLNESLVTEGFERFWAEIKVSPPTAAPTPPHSRGSATDGIQADRSFHQHGAQLLAGEYGEGYANDIINALGLANGTGYFVDNDRLELFVELILDGMRWMTVHQYYWQWSVVGRNLHSSPVRAHFSKFLSDLPSNRSRELKDFASALADGQEVALAGHRAFWCSDYAVQSSVSPFDGTAWLATVHMHSNRTVAARCVNSGGANSEHIADGMVYLYYKGNEYHGVFQTWDWTRLPGTTVEQLPVHNCNYSSQLAKDSAMMRATGTASDGLSGMSAMFLQSHNLTAKKAFALTEHALIGLVADIECDSSNEVVTTIENCAADGNVSLWRGGALEQVPLGTTLHPYEGVSWVHHSNTGYFILEDDQRHQPPAVSVSYAKSTDHNAYFSIGISHGRNSTGLRSTAAYITIPGISLSQMMGMRDSNGTQVSVVANTGAIQGVMDFSRQQSLNVFWMPGQLYLPSWDISISSDRTALVLVRRSKNGYSITASDPTNDPIGISLQVVLSGLRLTGPVCQFVETATTFNFSLPSGWSAGQSVTAECVTAVTEV